MFGLFESSRTLGQPLELYEFQVGANTYRYCNAEKDFTYAGAVFTAAPIKHSAISASGALDKATMTVTIADTLPLAALLRGYPSSAVIRLILRQGHKDDPDVNFLVAWIGRVLGAQGDPETGTRALSCQPASTSLQRIGLRRKWQYPCPHVLYGDQCRADQLRATVTAIIRSVGTNQIGVNDNWQSDKPTDKFAGGLAVYGSQIRTILAVSGNTITLGGPVDAKAIGQSVNLSLGCNHLRDDCQNVHVPFNESNPGGGNIHNYGGQPFIPTTNPIGYVSNYS
jgi:hypothetical protein